MKTFILLLMITATVEVHSDGIEPFLAEVSSRMPPESLKERSMTFNAFIRNALGDEEASDQLIALMQSTDNALFQDLFQSPGISYAEAYQGKLDELRNRFAAQDRGEIGEPISVMPADLATLMTLGALARLQPDDPTHVLASYEVFRPETGRLLTSNTNLARLYNVWAASLGNGDSAWRALRRAYDLRLQQALPAARTYAEAEDTSAALRAMAIVLIGRLGDAKDLSTLEPLLSDHRLPRDENAGSTDPMQVRDLALVTLIERSGERPSDYGFRIKPPQQQLYTKFGFETQAARDNAIKAWRAKPDLETPTSQ